MCHYTVLDFAECGHNTELVDECPRAREAGDRCPNLDPPQRWPGMCPTCVHWAEDRERNQQMRDHRQEEEDMLNAVLQASLNDQGGARHAPDDDDADLLAAIEASKHTAPGRPAEHWIDNDDELAEALRLSAQSAQQATTGHESDDEEMQRVLRLSEEEHQRHNERFPTVDDGADLEAILRQSEQEHAQHLAEQNSGRVQYYSILNKHACGHRVDGGVSNVKLPPHPQSTYLEEESDDPCPACFRDSITNQGRPASAQQGQSRPPSQAGHNPHFNSGYDPDEEEDLYNASGDEGYGHEIPRPRHQPQRPASRHSTQGWVEDQAQQHVQDHGYAPPQAHAQHHGEQEEDEELPPFTELDQRHNQPDNNEEDHHAMRGGWGQPGQSPYGNHANDMAGGAPPYSSTLSVAVGRGWARRTDGGSVGNRLRESERLAQSGRGGRRGRGRMAEVIEEEEEY